MVYIPFPRTDLDTDADLQAWRKISPKKERDWKKLRDFLTKQPRIKPKNDAIPKCWYTELPQSGAVLGTQCLERKDIISSSTENGE